MQVNAATGELAAQSADAWLVGLYEDRGLTGGAALVDAELGGALAELQAHGALPAARGRVTVVHPLQRGVRHVALVGLGPASALSPEVIRAAAAQGWCALRDQGAAHIVAVVSRAASDAGMPFEATTEAVVEGVMMAGYRFHRYRHPESEAGEPHLTVYAPEAEADDDLHLAIHVGGVVAEATNLARDLVNTGPSDLRPPDLVAEARLLAHEFGLGFRVLDEEALRAQGFGLLLAVNRGSPVPPALIVLEHRGGGDGPTLGLIGKGVCFDSGGLSLKTGDGMMTMKGDMGGAAAVLATLWAVSRLELPLNVTGIIPAVQNLVDAGSVMPGDVVTGLAGKSVEILNTDAEGRLILADALTYATRELGLAPVVDIATLTGACMRALGPAYAGIFGTDPELVARVRAAGAQAGEKLWELPLDEEFAELMKSPIADLRNISKEAGGGASTAAEFLKAFVGDTPWAHLDIAGQVISDKDRPYRPKGATGYGVRTLVNLCQDLAAST